MKVAAYCRVSTDKADQANSFESQQRYFREYIERQPGWELFEIYADEGITGTSTEKRTAFNRMIRDAKLRKFDRILTKEVSRFSRNILDSISYTRELKQIGVGVQFMNDGINTLDPDAELRLSIIASIAQEESRKTSSRVKWGQQRRMEQGVVFGRSLLGYDVRHGKMTINPEGANVVRMIFDKYVYQRKGVAAIAKELREAGVRTLSGSLHWRNTVILKILRNEKYCGDLKQKKTYTPDYLTHKKKYNHGEEAFVFLRDHHEPIISRALWEEAQREICRRDLAGNFCTGHGNRYPLSGKIKCGECGKSFVSRVRRRRDGVKYRTWRCGTAASEGKQHTDLEGNTIGCDLGYQLRDDVCMEIVRQTAAMLEIDTESVLCGVTQLVMKAIQTSQNSDQKNTEKLEKELAQLFQKKTDVLDAFFSKSISETDMKQMNAVYDSRIAALAERRTEIENAEPKFSDLNGAEAELTCAVKRIIHGEIAAEKFLGNLLDHITVFPDRHVEVQLKLLPTRWRYIL